MDTKEALILCCFVAVEVRASIANDKLSEWKWAFGRVRELIWAADGREAVLGLEKAFLVIRPWKRGRSRAGRLRAR
jgi:hypothetical protein